MVVQELQLACRLVPELAEVTPQRLLQDPTSWEGLDVLAAMAAADQLMPHANRNNGQTLRWGWERKGHGPRVIAMLAVALLEPQARDRCKYFAGLALKPKPPGFDLRPNLLRLLHGKGKGGLQLVAPADSVARARDTEERRAQAAAEAQAKADLMAAPGADDPVWQAIDAKLRAGAVRQGAYGAWFPRIGFHGIEDGVLMLSTPNPRAAERIRDEHARAVRDAAREAGHEVDQVMVTLRRSP